MSKELAVKEGGKVARPVFEQMAVSAEHAFLQVADRKTWLREIGFALQILRGNADGFAKCDPNSIKDAVINLALTGATLNPAMQQAYLIPRSIKGRLRCSLDFSYRGLVNIAVDSDSVLDIDATCVYEKDKFFYQQGLNPMLDHVPTMEGKRGELIGVYAIAILHHGIKKFIYLSKDDVEKARKSSTAPNSPAWTQWYEEMARKTAVKRLYKLLPQTERMSTAVAVVNEHEGLDTGRDTSKAAEVMKRFAEPEKAVAAEADPCTKDVNSCGHALGPDNGEYGCELNGESCPHVKKEAK